MQLLTVASEGSGTAYPGGFLMSARQADPSGAAAHQAARSAAGQEAQKNAAIEAVNAGAPSESGNSASKADAMIFMLGRKAAAQAGKTWQWSTIMMMITFITFKSSLVPLFEGL